jgi:hypothetical protein
VRYLAFDQFEFTKHPFPKQEDREEVFERLKTLTTEIDQQGADKTNLALQLLGPIHAARTYIAEEAIIDYLIAQETKLGLDASKYNRYYCQPDTPGREFRYSVIHGTLPSKSLVLLPDNSMSLCS